LNNRITSEYIDHIEDEIDPEQLLRLGNDATFAQKYKHLQELDLKPADLRKAFRELNLRPDLDFECAAIPRPQLGNVRAELDRFCRRAKKIMPQREPEEGWDELQVLIRLALRWQKNLDLTDDCSMQRLLAAMDMPGRINFDRWPDMEEAVMIKNAFDTFRTQLLKPARKAWREYRQNYLVRFLLPAVRHYRQDLKRI
jgi:ATP-dependent helicase/nuclease subunit A